ncbi:MAG: hypothetical protein FJ189_06790 [Gammaproteobacteria bacterium]|nr:hypothetical protein [Gammaproteobacteria bacterium]
MGALHIVSRGGFAPSSLATCLRFLHPGDVLLLVDAAVEAAVHGSPGARQLAALPAGVTVRVLVSSLLEAGSAGRRLIKGAEFVDFDGFVDLADACTTSVSWG